MTNCYTITRTISMKKITMCAAMNTSTHSMMCLGRCFKLTRATATVYTSIYLSTYKHRQNKSTCPGVSQRRY